MGLETLQYFLFDCTGAKAKRGYYIVACFISVVSIATTLTSIISFCVDYLDEQAIYHSLPNKGHFIGYVLCLSIALVATVPTLVLAALAVHDLPQYEKRPIGFANWLCSSAKFDNFYCHGSATRYLLFATLSAATVILCNTLSVCALHYGVASLFSLATVARAGSSIDRLQHRLGCCGLAGPDDWKRRQWPGVPKSCTAELWTDGDSVESSKNITLVSSDGCAATLTGEQAAIKGISNMLVFTGVLLLLAAWTRVERVAELTAKDVRNLFNEPRATAEAAAFVERIGRQRSTRLSAPFRPPPRLSRLSNKAVKSSAEATVKRLSLQSSHASSAGQYQRPLISDGFLYPTSDDDVELRCAVSRSRKLSSIPYGWSHIANCSLRRFDESNADMNGGRSRNNSALDLSGPWLGAQVINPFSTYWPDDSDASSSDGAEQLEDEGAPLATDVTKDVVQMTNEIEAESKEFNQLDVKRLERVDSDGLCCTLNQRRRFCRRIAKSNVNSYNADLTNFPVFLFDFSEDRWTNQLRQDHQALEMPFNRHQAADKDHQQDDHGNLVEIVAAPLFRFASKRRWPFSSRCIGCGHMRKMKHLLQQLDHSKKQEQQRQKSLLLSTAGGNGFFSGINRLVGVLSSNCSGCRNGSRWHDDHPGSSALSIELRLNLLAGFNLTGVDLFPSQFNQASKLLIVVRRGCGRERRRIIATEAAVDGVPSDGFGGGGGGGAVGGGGGTRVGNGAMTALLLNIVSKTFWCGQNFHRFFYRCFDACSSSFWSLVDFWLLLCFWFDGAQDLTRRRGIGVRTGRDWSLTAFQSEAEAATGATLNDNRASQLLWWQRIFSAVNESDGGQVHSRQTFGVAKIQKCSARNQRQNHFARTFELSSYHQGCGWKVLIAFVSGTRIRRLMRAAEAPES
uniref:PHM7_ext domain-containing protein n=1 Tax=Macrostomum lignano TaxID=282301 RepID=A0A1I8H118_9PLAT